MEASEKDNLNERLSRQKRESLARREAIEAEEDRRSLDALRLYVPMPIQEKFHACAAPVRLLRKGNRAGGPLPVSTPVLTPSGWTPIGDLNPGDRVVGGDGRVCQVTDTFRQGILATFKLTFDDGATVVCSEDHYWKCKLKKSERFGRGRIGKWGVYSLEEIRKHGGDEPCTRERAVIPCAVCEMDAAPVPLDPYTLGVLLGDGAISQSVVSFTTEDKDIADNVEACLAGSAKISHRAGTPGSKASCYGIVRAADKPRTNLVKEALAALGLMGLLSHQKFIPHCYLENSIDARLQLLRGLMDTDGFADKKGHTYFYTSSPLLADGVCRLVRSLGGKATVRWRETDIGTARDKKRGRPFKPSPNVPRKKCLNMAVVWIDLPHFSPFGIERKTARWESRKRLPIHGRFLEKIEPFGNAECCCIRVDSPDHTFVTQDYIVTHNTVATMVETARAARHMDPHGKYPTDRGLTIWIVVYEEQNIGRTVFRMLFRPGLFWIIRDSATGKWRAWDPESADDLARKKDRKPSPPLIPVEEIEGGTPGMVPTKCPGISWVKRGQRIFRLVRLKNGTHIYTMCSGSEPPMGDPIDLGVIDEDLKSDRMMISELQARTADYDGKIIWSLWPKTKNPAALALSDQAAEQKDWPEPDVVEFRMEFMGNKYIPLKNRQQRYRMWQAQGEEIARSRNTGDYMLDAVRMYPEFDVNVHGVPNVNDPDCLDRSAYDHNIDWFLRTRRIPDDWCRFLWIDPGFTTAAGLFLAVPPPEIGEWVVAYDEIYLVNSTLETFGGEVRRRVDRGERFHGFGIDWHYSRRHEWTSGRIIKEQVVELFKKLNIRSASTGHSLRDGSDDVPGRIAKVRSWLAVRKTPEGEHLAPKFRVLRAPGDPQKSTCPHMEAEFRLYMKKFNHDEATDEPIKGNDHLMNALEYAAHDPMTRWHRPRGKPVDAKQTGLMAMLSGRDDSSKKHFHLGPGPIPHPLQVR